MKNCSNKKIILTNTDNAKGKLFDTIFAFTPAPNKNSCWPVHLVMLICTQ